MAKNLLIVESPAKAKTIEKILGKDFEVRSCYGHIRDLDKENMGVDIEHGYSPHYVIPAEKHKVVDELKKLSKSSEEIWLASDEDREGESISWHLSEVLGLDPTLTKRIVFHEITVPAIRRAVEKPRLINMDLVNAQQARRVLDRLVGFELSPVLWRKIGMQRSLSAGRVQSVAVRLIVEREREINSFIAQSSYKVEAIFMAPSKSGKNMNFSSEGPTRLSDAGRAKAFLEQCRGANYKVSDIQVKPSRRTPAAPFTTSTLQQEASRKLGYSVSRTMLLAQRLYESGLITYMRTDSVNLSETAMHEIESEICSVYGKEYFNPRVFKNKIQSAQEAHEAIRPTYMSNHTITEDDGKALYELIWRRTIASQMSDAEFEKTIAKISISTCNDLLTATGEVLQFDGFLKVYMEGHDDEDEEESKGMLPPLKIGDSPEFIRMTATERFTRPLPRYTEASLVKKLEELGIGRPSTYAPTISTIMKRNYVEKLDRAGHPRNITFLTLDAEGQIGEAAQTEMTGVEKSKLFPTDLGMVVTDFLKEHFEKVMDYGFTAKMEQGFDEIAGGRVKWNSMIDEFYKPFHIRIEDTMENAKREKGERLLGTDPVSGKPVTARIGRYGPMAQIGTAEDEEKPRFARLKQEQRIDTISLEEALELFKLPRLLGKFEDADVSVNIGRFGPYAAHDGKFYSLNKEMDPYKVTLEEVAPMIVEKRKAKAERTIKEFEKEKIKILKGPYGPYIKKGLRNFKLSHQMQERASEITLEEAQKVIEEELANPSSRKRKRPAKKEPTSKGGAKKKA